MVKEMQMPFGLIIRFVDLDLISVNFNSTVMWMVPLWIINIVTTARFSTQRSKIPHCVLWENGVRYLKRQIALGYHKRG